MGRWPPLLAGPFSCLALMRALDLLAPEDALQVVQDLRPHAPELAVQKV